MATFQIFLLELIPNILNKKENSIFNTLFKITNFPTYTTKEITVDGPTAVLKGVFIIRYFWMLRV